MLKGLLDYIIQLIIISKLEGEGKMRDKILVVSTLLIALMVISMTVAPSLAFVYPDGSQDNLFEIFGPRIDKILIKKYASLDAEMQALQAGEIDFTDWALTKTWVDTFAVDPDVRVLGYGGEAGYYTMNFNNNPNQYLGNPPDPLYPNPVYTTNPCVVTEFRQACSYLIDRVALSAGPGQGMYTPIFTPIPASMAFWIHPNIGPWSALAYPPSVADAAAALDAGGFKMGGPGGKRYWDRNDNDVYDSASEDLNIILYSRLDKLSKGAADMLCAGLDDPTIQVAYTRYQVAGGVAWQKCMVEKDYHMYTAGWIHIGPDPDYLYDLYHWDNYYHPEDPPNFGGISWNDPVMQDALERLKSAPALIGAKIAAFDFQVRFAEVAAECPLASTDAPKAYNKWYTGGNDGVALGDAEDKYRGQDWTQVVNEMGQGENSYYTFLNAYPGTYQYGDGNMIARYGWCDNTMPQTLNPMYSSWYWESDIYGRIYDSLGGRDPMTKGPIQVPYLADHWEVGTWVDPRDGITKAAITVQIRPDVLWSDGVPLTIDDVIYTFIDMAAALRAKGCPDVWWQPTLDQIAGFFRLDEYTVQVLMKVNAVWAVNWIVGNIVVPKHLWQPYIATHTVPEISGDFSGRDTYMLVGTGPFLYVENTPNTVLMIRNPAYYQMIDKCINQYTDTAQNGITVTAISPSTQISPFKIKEDGTGKGHATIYVYVTNLDRLHPQDFDKKVELVCPNATTVVLAPTHNIVLPEWGLDTEPFLVHLNIGYYTIKVTLEIKSGHNYDWITANLPPTEWAKWLGPIVVQKKFWITVPADLNEDGTVDGFDVGVVNLAFGSTIGDPNYNPKADINRDCRVTAFDLLAVAQWFGWPNGGIPLKRDVVVTGITNSSALVTLGDPVSFDVTVENKGDLAEAFGVSVFLNVYANTTLLGKQMVNLLSKTQTILTFDWDTAGFLTGPYKITAIAEKVPDEIDITNNDYTLSIVQVQALMNHTISVFNDPANSILLPFTINNTKNVSPWAGGLAEDTYVVTVPATFVNNETIYKFREWEDSSTNPERMINLNADKNIMAYYEVSATSLPIICTSPIVTSSDPDKNFKVNIDITNVTDLHDWEFTLYYDTRFMDFDTATEGPFLKSQGSTAFQLLEVNDSHNNTHGKIRLKCNLVGSSSSKSGNGTLATITMNSTAKGNSILVVEDTKLNNPLSIPIPCNTLQGLGLIRVKMAADINNDGIVDIFDLVQVAVSFGRVKGDPPNPPSHNGYNPHADVVQDDVIDIFDIVVVAVSFGKIES